MQDNFIHRLHNSDSSVISILYDDFGAALYNVVLRIVHSPELAQQVLQDTFVKIWMNRMQYDSSRGRLFTWMLNIARNTAIDATRTVLYKQQHKTDNLVELIDKPGPEIVNTDFLDLRKIIDHLDTKYQTLINLIYFQGYTQQEVAEQTGIPLGTIKTRIRYAIMQMRHAFGSVNKPISV